MSTTESKISVSSRIVLAFVFLYHGLVPKILWLDATEIQMIELHKLNFSTQLVAYTGGVLEMVLALAILFLRKSLWPVYIAAAALVILLLDVIVFAPHLLTGAFNPVTTNIMALYLCYIIVNQNSG